MVESPEDPAHRERPGTPRWVIALGIAAIFVVLLVVAVMLIAGGEHGPGRHAGQAVHESTPGDAAMQQEHAEAVGHLPDVVAHEQGNCITLRPGETKQLTWRFGGTAEYGCHEPGHYEAGMRGRITVS